MFNAGLQIDRAEFAAVSRRFGLFVRALVANFVIVPLAAYAVVKLLQVNDLVATGLLLMAICPGVPFVVLTGGRRKGGSHELAVALAVVMPLLSFFTIPLVADLILPRAERVSVPPSQLFSLLLFQLIPLLLGVLGAAFAPAIAEKLKKPLGRLTMLSLLALVAVLAPAIVRSVAAVFGSRGIIAAIAIDVVSLTSGWLLGGPRHEERFTLGIGTGLRNPATAMLVATTSFAGTIVSATVMTYFLVQFVGATVFGGRGILRFLARRHAAS